MPSTATITSISISQTWSPSPNPTGTNYLAKLCLDSQDTQCAAVNPSFNGRYSWTTSTSGFSGLSAATTTFHLTAALTDGNMNNPIKTAINPPRHLSSKSITVNYTY